MNICEKKILKLSRKAQQELPKFERVWEAGQKSVKEIINSIPEFLIILDEFETQIEKESFRNRVMRKLE